jgi:hypothetical protein
MVGFGINVNLVLSEHMLFVTRCIMIVKVTWSPSHYNAYKGERTVSL